MGFFYRTLIALDQLLIPLCSIDVLTYVGSEVTQSCPTLCDPMDCSLPGSSVHGRLLCPWNFPGNSTGVDCHFLRQRIFPTQGSNPGLPHCRQTLYRLSHQGSPGNICWKVSPITYWKISLPICNISIRLKTSAILKRSFIG